MRVLVVAVLLTLLAPAAPATASRGAGPAGPAELAAQPAVASPGAPSAESRAVPRLRITRPVRRLDHPWDVRPIGNRRLLVTERDRARLTVWERGKKRTVRFPSGQVWVSGETGLMGLEVDPDFANNHRIYTCQGGSTGGGGHDVRVLAWRLNQKATRATKIKLLRGGLPATSGRHGGCRLLITRDGALLVATGDAAEGKNPESLTSLGGKTLRLNRITGAPWPTNPFANARHPHKRYVHTYGHRNVQGLAERADGSLWSIEQGTDRDDEVNRLVPGGDYGYNPVPGYNEGVPMTDRSLPGKQVRASWSSGSPTLATCGGAWVSGGRWGALDGTLAVAALKAGRIVFLDFDDRGRLLRSRAPRALRDFGRLRSVTSAPNGDLLVTTDNGNGNDVVLRVHPR